MESVRSLIRVLAVLLRLFIKSLLYLEWMHSSKVSTVSVRWLKVFSRLPVVSVFQPNRVTLTVLMKGNNHYMWKGFVGVSFCLSLSACCECKEELCLSRVSLHLHLFAASFGLLTFFYLLQRKKKYVRLFDSVIVMSLSTFIITLPSPAIHLLY